MPDLKISELPAANSLSDTDVTPLVQNQGSLATRRATLSQLRGAVLRERGVHIRDFGAVGDGVADDGPALQAAIDALSPAGGVVHLGARTYRIGTAVTVSGHAVRIEGQGFTEGGNPGEGTWLTCANPAIFPLTFSGAAARGSVVRNLAVREMHGASQNASWQPTAYQWFFRVLDCLGGVDFEDLLLSGVHRGFLVRNSGRTAFRRIRGQVFATGIEMDEVYDVVRITGVHFWPFWSANDNVVRWQQQNGDAMIFRRVDGVFVDQSFVLGYRSMFRFASSAAGVTQKFSIGQAYADFVRHGLWVEAAGTDGQVDSMSVQCERFNANGATLPGSVGILLGAHSCRVQVGQLRVDDCEDHAIRVEGHSNRLDIGSLRVVHFNQRGNGAAACHIAHAATGAPNRVILATAPMLEGTTNGGPLVNGGTNGTLGGLMAAGAAPAPGLAVGAPDTGLFQPAAASLAASAGGAEVMRLSSGTATLGGPAGGHGFEVATPANAVNRPRALGAATGQAVSIQASGNDANLDLGLEAKGGGSLVLRTGGGAQAQVAHAAAAVNQVQLSGGATGAPVRILAVGADANIPLVISPKGSGALIAQVPDGTAGGGHARGANAVDWQQSRSQAAAVAGGTNATVGGGNNNSAAGLNAVVAGGDGNAASATNSTVLGGFSNTADGNSAWVTGGRQASTRGSYGRGAWASGRFSSNGDAQGGEFVLRATSTDGAAQRLTADTGNPNSGNTVNLPNNGAYRLHVLVVAQQAGGTAGTVGDCASWEFGALVRRGATAADTALVGGFAIPASLAPAAISNGSLHSPFAASPGAAGWRASLGHDAAAGGLAVSGIGEANKTIRWVARILSAEVAA